MTASARAKTYGQSVTLAGTEFTTSGLLNSDTVTAVTLTSSGAAATATVASSPYSIVPSAAVGAGLANYTIAYANGALTVHSDTADGRVDYIRAKDSPCALPDGLRQKSVPHWWGSI